METGYFVLAVALFSRSFVYLLHFCPNWDRS